MVAVRRRDRLVVLRSAEHRVLACSRSISALSPSQVGLLVGAASWHDEVGIEARLGLEDRESCVALMRPVERGSTARIICTSPESSALMRARLSWMPMISTSSRCGLAGFPVVVVTHGHAAPGLNSFTLKGPVPFAEALKSF
jgi:hypothetical protein